MNLHDVGFEFVMEQARLVWNMLPLKEDEYRYLFIKSGRGTRGTWVKSEAALARIVGLATPMENVYIQLNPAHERIVGRPSSQDVTRLQAILVDIDPVGEDNDQTKPIMATHFVQKWLMEHGVTLEQIAWIDSGRGRQLWILLRDDSDYTGVHNIQRVRTLIQRAGEALKTQNLLVRIDPSCVDAVRLARMPGSTNLKTTRSATVLRGALPGSGLFLGNFYPTPVPESVVAPKISSDKWWHYIPHLTSKAQDFIFLGITSPGRHAACFATAMSLAESSVPDEIAKELIVAGCGRCYPPLAPNVGLRAWYQAKSRILEREACVSKEIVDLSVSSAMDNVIEDQ